MSFFPTTPIRAFYIARDPASSLPTTTCIRDDLYVNTKARITYGAPPGALGLGESPIHIDACRVIVNDHIMRNSALNDGGQQSLGAIMFNSLTHGGRLEIWNIVGFGKPQEYDECDPLIELRCDNLRRLTAVFPVQTLFVEDMRQLLIEEGVELQV